MWPSHTYLPGCFTIKNYSLKLTTWSTSSTQQSPIVPVNTSQIHWRDVGLPRTQYSIFKSFLRDWEWQGKLGWVSLNVFSKKTFR